MIRVILKAMPLANPEPLDSKDEGRQNGRQIVVSLPPVVHDEARFIRVLHYHGLEVELIPGHTNPEKPPRSKSSNRQQSNVRWLFKHISGERPEAPVWCQGRKFEVTFDTLMLAGGHKPKLYRASTPAQVDDNDSDSGEDSDVGNIAPAVSNEPEVKVPEEASQAAPVAEQPAPCRTIKSHHYVGIFVTAESKELLLSRYPPNAGFEVLIAHPRVTVEFAPALSTIDTSVVGRPVQLRVIQLAQSDQYHCVLVEVMRVESLRIGLQRSHFHVVLARKQDAKFEQMPAVGTTCDPAGSDAIIIQGVVGVCHGGDHDPMLTPAEVQLWMRVQQTPAMLLEPADKALFDHWGVIALPDYCASEPSTRGSREGLETSSEFKSNTQFTLNLSAVEKNPGPMQAFLATATATNMDLLFVRGVDLLRRAFDELASLLRWYMMSVMAVAARDPQLPLVSFCVEKGLEVMFGDDDGERAVSETSTIWYHVRRQPWTHIDLRFYCKGPGADDGETSNIDTVLVLYLLKNVQALVTQYGDMWFFQSSQAKSVAYRLQKFRLWLIHRAYLIPEGGTVSEMRNLHYSKVQQALKCMVLLCGSLRMERLDDRFREAIQHGISAIRRLQENVNVLCQSREYLSSDEVIKTCKMFDKQSAAAAFYTVMAVATRFVPMDEDNHEIPTRVDIPVSATSVVALGETSESSDFLCLLKVRKFVFTDDETVVEVKSYPLYDPFTVTNCDLINLAADLFVTGCLELSQHGTFATESQSPLPGLIDWFMRSPVGLPVEQDFWPATDVLPEVVSKQLFRPVRSTAQRVTVGSAAGTGRQPWDVLNESPYAHDPRYWLEFFSFLMRDERRDQSFWTKALTPEVGKQLKDCFNCVLRDWVAKQLYMTFPESMNKEFVKTSLRRFAFALDAVCGMYSTPQFVSRKLLLMLAGGTQIRNNLKRSGRAKPMDAEPRDSLLGRYRYIRAMQQRVHPQQIGKSVIQHLRDPENFEKHTKNLAQVLAALRVRLAKLSAPLAAPSSGAATGAASTLRDLIDDEDDSDSQDSAV